MTKLAITKMSLFGVKNRTRLRVGAFSLIISGFLLCFFVGCLGGKVPQEVLSERVDQAKSMTDPYADPSIRALRDRLDKMNNDMEVIATGLDSSSQIVEAVDEGDEAKAVGAFLNFYEVDQKAEKLKAVKTKVDAGSNVGQVMSTMAEETPELIDELLIETKKQVTGNHKAVTDLIPDITKAVGEIRDQIASLQGAPAAEKARKVKALEDMSDQANTVQTNAREMKTGLEMLLESIDKLTEDQESTEDQD